eukprot:27603-Pelagococcus_subviridis.AAC.1
MRVVHVEVRDGGLDGSRERRRAVAAAVAEVAAAAAAAALRALFPEGETSFGPSRARPAAAAAARRRTVNRRAAAAEGRGSIRANVGVEFIG